jgi:hypothetical protein
MKTTSKKVRTSKVKAKTKTKTKIKPKRGFGRRWKSRKEREMTVLANGPLHRYIPRRDANWFSDDWDEVKQEQFSVVQFKPQVRNLLMSAYHDDYDQDYQDEDQDDQQPKIIKTRRARFRAYHLSFPHMVFALFDNKLWVCFTNKTFKSFCEFKKSKELYSPAFSNTNYGLVCLDVRRLSIEDAVKKFWNTLFDGENYAVAEWPDLRTYNRWHEQTKVNPKFIKKMRWPREKLIFSLDAFDDY